MNMQQSAPPNTPVSSYEVPPYVQNVGDSIGETYNDVSQSIKNSIDGFSTPAEAGEGASIGFLQSNTLIAKFAFIMLIIIVFVVLLNLGILLIQYFTSSNNPYIQNNMISGSSSKTVNQDPSNPDSILVKRSNNESGGIEFTWSTWIKIDEIPETDTTEKYQHIFHKGVNDFKKDGDGIALTTNGPGLYVKPYKPTQNVATIASLRVIMSTNQDGNNNYIDIDDIPLKRWVNVIIRMQNTTVDVYINGTISGRLNLTDVPLQNYYPVQICQNGGFEGSLSSLRYYDNALNIFQITKIVAAGPNTKIDDAKLEKNYNYLSTSWYTAKV